MRFFSYKIILNFFFVFLLFYLAYHTVHGRYNIQYYLINKFELKLFQDFQYNLKQKSMATDMDLNALYLEKSDYMDELSKRYSSPSDGETLLKID